MWCANEVYRGLRTSNLILKTVCNLPLNTGGEELGFIYADGLVTDFLIPGFSVFVNVCKSAGVMSQTGSSTLGPLCCVQTLHILVEPKRYSKKILVSSPKLYGCRDF